MALWVGLFLLMQRAVGQVNSAWYPGTISTQESEAFNTGPGPQPLFANGFWPLVGFTCSGTNCGTKVIAGGLNAVASTSNISLFVDVSTVALTDFVTSTALPTTNCPLGSVVVRIICTGTDCVVIQLQCMRPSAFLNIWRTVNNSTYVYVGPFGSPDSKTCPPSSVMCGISCISNGCGSILLRCCYVEIRVCDAGYAFDSNYACEGVACAIQDDPSNGMVTSTNRNSYPSTSTLQCNDGYNVSGDPQRVCEANGSWAGVAATCVGLTCLQLASVVNGSFTLSNGYIYPTTAIFSCSPGYVASQDSRACLNDGSWAGDEVVCTGIRCATLPEPDHGVVTVSNNHLYPAIASLVCDPGFNIVGSSQLSCSTTGAWTSSFGSCVGRVCDTLPPNNRYIVTLVNNGRYPSTAFITCNPGTVGSTNILSCNPNGTWTGTIPECPYVSCGLPPDPGGNYCNDTDVCTNWTTPTNLTYHPLIKANVNWTCQPGWTWYGAERSITCQSNGVWSNLDTTCRAVYCNALPNIPGASLTISNQQWYPSVGVYTCLGGYIANGTMNGTMTCLKDRTWAGDLTFSCVARLCDIVNFSTPQCNCKSQTSNGGFYPSATYFECLPGYVYSSGSTLRECRTDGSWSNTNLMCVGISCLPLNCSPVPCNVTFTNNRIFPSNAQAVCPAGYLPSVAGGFTKCTTDGNWEDSVTCIGVPCATVPPVQNGTRSATSSVYPSTVLTSCDAGYMLSGGAQFLTCGTNGVWSGAFPSCVVALPVNFSSSCKAYSATNITTISGPRGSAVVVQPDAGFNGTGVITVDVLEPDETTASVIVRVIFIGDNGPQSVVGLLARVVIRIPLIPVIWDVVKVCLGEEVTEKTVEPECKYFDEATKTWRSDGCERTNLTSTELECTCSHLTDFAAVLPRYNAVPIEAFRDMTSENIAKYPTGIIAVVVVLMVFAAVLMFSVYRDRKEASKAELKSSKHAKWRENLTGSKKRTLWKELKVNFQLRHTWASLINRKSGWGDPYEYVCCVCVRVWCVGISHLSQCGVWVYLRHFVSVRRSYFCRTYHGLVSISIDLNRNKKSI